MWRVRDAARLLRRAHRLGDPVVLYHVSTRVKWLARWARGCTDVRVLSTLEEAGAAALVALDRACRGCEASLRVVLREAYGRSPAMKEELHQQRIQFLYGVRPPAAPVETVGDARALSLAGLPLDLERYHPLVRVAITDGELSFRRSAVRYIIRAVPAAQWDLYADELDVSEVVAAVRQDMKTKKRTKCDA